MREYRDFIQQKVVSAPESGIEIARGDLHPALFEFQKDIVYWALRGGRRAVFASFGLGKTLIQLEIARQITQREAAPALIVLPLGVRQEFVRDAAVLGMELRYVRNDAEVATAVADGIHVVVTNYERVRDGHLSAAQLRAFSAVLLDEAAILRGFGGTKTFRKFMALFEGTATYRFVATATPSPNEFIELLAYAAFLDVMDVGQAKTRFFKRDSTKADQLTLHPHKEREFWLWVSTWALFVTKPSDLGYSDEGYELPPLNVVWHEIPTDHTQAGHTSMNQGRLFRETNFGVQDASREKRDSLPARVRKLMEIVRSVPLDHSRWMEDQPVIWCDLNDEQKAIERALTAPDVSVTVSSLYGSQDIDEREVLLAAWRACETEVFLSKPMMYGAGINLQQSHTMIFAGIGFKFADMIQAVHRIYRFLQQHPCTVHLIYTEAERDVRRQLERKWKQHDALVANMTAIVREYGLASAATRGLARSITVERREASGPGWTLVNNDTVDETARMESDSVGLILTSIPFSSQYEYTPSYLDFGHTDDERHFWAQMDFLTPQLLRVLQPGRVFACHVKDRIQPGGLTGLGFQTVQPFHADAIYHYTRHGFAYLGMKTIVTDVVRENMQTYRLGWTEQCKDGSRMGVGMPEYLLLFRKPPTDLSDGYADLPVVKSKDDYTRGRWQLDAHGFARSSGNRLLTPADLVGVASEKIYKLFRQYSLDHAYDFEHHVALCEALEAKAQLPADFMLMPPPSWHPDVWTDVARMRTLNGAQQAKGKEMHLCPLQFDIVDRAIVQYTMPGELVFDPFAGLGTVPVRAVDKGRRGRGHELNPAYWADSVWYARTAAEKRSMPSLFDLVEAL